VPILHIGGDTTRHHHDAKESVPVVQKVCGRPETYKWQHHQHQPPLSSQETSSVLLGNSINTLPQLVFSTADEQISLKKRPSIHLPEDTKVKVFLLQFYVEVLSFLS